MRNISLIDARSTLLSYESVFCTHTHTLIRQAVRRIFALSINTAQHPNASQYHFASQIESIIYLELTKQFYFGPRSEKILSLEISGLVRIIDTEC